jgi:hypothetical protein
MNNRRSAPLPNQDGPTEESIRRMSSRENGNGQADHGYDLERLLKRLRVGPGGEGLNGQAPLDRRKVRDHLGLD